MSTKSNIPQIREKTRGALHALCRQGKVLEWHGHFKNGEMFYQGWPPSERHNQIRDHLKSVVTEALLLGLTEDTKIEALERAVKAGVLLDEPIALNAIRSFQCPACGEFLRMGFNGQGFVVIADPCPNMTGIVTEWELNVPSGKILVANDLRRWFPAEDNYNINTLIGTHRATLAYAGVGMSHGFVGNTCPNVYRNGDDRYVIGSYADTLWEEDEEVSNPEPCPWGESVASICTDLWWFSIVDYDEFLRRVPHYTPDRTLKEIFARGMEIVDVRPGVYRFRQEQGVDRDASTVEFASFEWVRAPDEITDFLKIEREKSITAIEVLVESCISWPSLFLRSSTLDDHDRSRRSAITLWKSMSLAEKTVSLAAAADHLMCTSGNGIDWHENGFPRCSISPEAKLLAAEIGEVPAFDVKMNWYPVSADSGAISLGAGIKSRFLEEEIRFAPTFVLLALNICRNMIKFGGNLRRDEPASDLKTRMRFSISLYRKLRSRYPDIVFDKEFDRWVQETDLKGYVRKFQFEREPEIA